MSKKNDGGKLSMCNKTKATLRWTVAAADESNKENGEGLPITDCKGLKTNV